MADNVCLTTHHTNAETHDDLWFVNEWFHALGEPHRGDGSQYYPTYACTQ